VAGEVGSLALTTGQASRTPPRRLRSVINEAIMRVSESCSSTSATKIIADEVLQEGTVDHTACRLVCHFDLAWINAWSRV